MVKIESFSAPSVQGKVYPPGLSAEELKTWQTMDFGSSLVRFKDREGHLAAFSERVKSGALGILAGDHWHHFDMANVKRLVDSMPEKPKKTKFVIATTLLEGDQGEPLQQFTLSATPALADSNIEYLGVYRGKQDDKYIHTEERRNEIMETNNANMRSLFREIRTGEELVIAAFLPGGITGARKRPLKEHPWPWGRRPGTLKVPNNLLPTLLRHCQKIKREVVVLPFTNVRTYKLTEPDTRHPTLYAKGVYVAQRLGFDTHASGLVAHSPLEIKDFERRGIDFKSPPSAEFDDAVNEAVMRIIVQPLPRGDKGYYK